MYTFNCFQANFYTELKISAVIVILMLMLIVKVIVIIIIVDEEEKNGRVAGWLMARLAKDFVES